VNCQFPTSSGGSRPRAGYTPNDFTRMRFGRVLKHDGFRTLAYIEDRGYKLISRKQVIYKHFHQPRAAADLCPNNLCH
jgi:hypothetical protein